MLNGKVRPLDVVARRRKRSLKLAAAAVPEHVHLVAAAKGYSPDMATIAATLHEVAKERTDLTLRMTPA